MNDYFVPFMQMGHQCQRESTEVQITQKKKKEGENSE
jgi:hypothetical protein